MSLLLINIGSERQNEQSRIEHKHLWKHKLKAHRSLSLLRRSLIVLLSTEETHYRNSDLTTIIVTCHWSSFTGTSLDRQITRVQLVTKVTQPFPPPVVAMRSYLALLPTQNRKKTNTVVRSLAIEECFKQWLIAIFRTRRTFINTNGKLLDTQIVNLLNIWHIDIPSNLLSDYVVYILCLDHLPNLIKISCDQCCLYIN